MMPISKDKNIVIDKPSTFFSFKIFINCGRSEVDVNIPATIPITPMVFNALILNLFFLCCFKLLPS
jgi:hypothetical protein